MSSTALRRVGVALTAATMSVAAMAGTSPAASAKAAEPWWFSALRLSDAHQKTTGEGVTVAVIDTAVDTKVPDLEGADIEFGAACEPNDTRSKPRIGDPVANHGTAMSTIIVGQGRGNGLDEAGITGAAPGATVRFYNDEPDPRQTDQDCDEADTVTLFDRAISDGVDIINYSATSSFGLEGVIRQAVDAGIVVVASAGKPGEGISSPASIPGVVAVYAVDKNARPWKGNPHMEPTNSAESWKFGFPVVSAPGVDFPAGAMDKNGTWTSGYSRTGTSDATALVSGLLALLKSAHPKATGNQLIQHLIHHTSDEKLDWNVRYGFGIASITEMLRHDPTTWPDVNPLLKGPEQAMADFPAAGEGGQTPAPEPDRSPASAASDSDEGGGTPSWLWPTAIIGALAIIAVPMIARRRTTESDTTRRTAEEAGS
ncbi:S8/S53 family peptidase [Aeromicrobium sp. NPDC092404]|uniref:S8 family peptidase n=1 Tax=Aeromicrobium sp. NPDC092404 TaxID=3154976 RepID=UPI00341ACA81